MRYTLRTRILFVLAIVFTLLGGTAYLIHNQVLHPNLLELERQHIGVDVQRVFHAIDNEVEHLSTITNDWSAWDDTYKFIIDKNAEYETSNLNDSSFTNNRINLIYLIDNSGQTVWGKAFSEDFETQITIQQFNHKQFTPDFPLTQYNLKQTPLSEQETSGLFMTSAGPMLCSARPIIDSNDKGPSRGTLIMGRLLGQDITQRISHLTSVEYKLKPVELSNKGDKPPEKQTLEQITYRAKDKVLSASTTYADLTGKPALEITVYGDRDILSQGLKALRFSLTLMAIGIAFALALMMLMLQRSVITPINRITQNVLARSKSKQAWESLDTGTCTSQEICSLNDEFNQLMENLDGKSHQLAETNFSLMTEAKKLKEAQSILKNLDRLKSEFISTAAHELRTPVTSIMGFTELLANYDKTTSFNEEQRRDFLKEIYDNCERLTKLVDDILDVSRIEAGRSIPLDKQVITTEALLNKVVNHFKIKAKHQLVVEIKADTPEIMRVDIHRISQVMENLLSNAIKYSPDESRIDVIAERDGRHCKVTVTDQGIGMNEEQLSHIFDKFYRADASDSAIRGLGLGMSIVKQIIKDHGGTIWVDSAPGEGTQVYFTLPSEDTA